MSCLLLPSALRIRIHVSYIQTQLCQELTLMLDHATCIHAIIVCLHCAELDVVSSQDIFQESVDSQATQDLYQV